MISTKICKKRIELRKIQSLLKITATERYSSWYRIFPRRVSARLINLCITKKYEPSTWIYFFTTRSDNRHLIIAKSVGKLTYGITNDSKVSPGTIIKLYFFLLRCKPTVETYPKQYFWLGAKENWKWKICWGSFVNGYELKRVLSDTPSP